MKKLGSVNPANLMALYSIRGKLLGWCLDSPNAFAYACQINEKVYKGIARYPYFGDTIRERNSDDNICRMRQDNSSLTMCVKFN